MLCSDCKRAGNKMELDDFQMFLRLESENRVIDRSEGFSLFDCLVKAINSASERLLRTTSVQVHRDEIRNIICDLLLNNSTQFQSVISLLVENFPSQESPSSQTETQIKHFYEVVISDCRDGRNLHKYTKLILYAASTCINTPIYVVCRNESKSSCWSYFQPLFTYEGQPESVLKYVTMAMTSENMFYNVESRDVSGRRPKASGLVGMYLHAFKAISPLCIDVPDELLTMSNDQKSTLCYTITRDIVKKACELFWERRYIQLDEYNKMTAHRASRKQFCGIVTRSADAFRVVCQVLINRQDKIVLSKFVRDWNLFVKACGYLQKFDSLTTLEDAIYERNNCVAAFVNRCQLTGQEFDERRKVVTTAVIASSSVGILSGGMVIAGLVLAPVSFGASLGLSIAGGVIGIGTGVAAGTARTVEAVKQNSKMNDIKAKQTVIEEKERNVSNALENTALLFNQHFRELQDAEGAEDIGISRRGFLAVGSAFRASHSIVNIALAAVRLSATAATVAGAVIGPLSLVVDIAFLTEAAHNKATGDKTNASKILKTIAETIETKSKIFNSMLRGNWNDTDRQVILHKRS